MTRLQTTSRPPLAAIKTLLTRRPPSEQKLTVKDKQTLDNANVI